MTRDFECFGGDLEQDTVKMSTIFVSRALKENDTVSLSLVGISYVINMPTYSNSTSPNIERTDRNVGRNTRLSPVFR